MPYRPLKSSDLPRLRELYAQSPTYLEPDWGKLVGEVLTDDFDRVLMWVAYRPTVEVYMGQDSGAWETPGAKFGHFERLHGRLQSTLKRNGYQDAHLWTACRGFLRKLRKRLGWRLSGGAKGEWVGLTRQV